MDDSADPVKIYRLIGEGLTSQVMECSIGAERYAMKVFKPETQQQCRTAEIQILKGLDHPHIVKILKYDTTIKQFREDPCQEQEWFIIELLQDKDLFDYIHALCNNHHEMYLEQPLDLPHCHLILTQLLSAIEHIHERGYAHRDIKLENILLHPITNTIKLCDFGFAQPLSQPGQRSIGTNGYMAPELSVSTFTGFASTIPGDDLVKSDIFSLGVCLFILVFGFPPFKSTASRDNCQLWKIFNSHRTDLFWKLTFKRAKPVPKELTQLLEGMMAPSIHDRFSIADIRNNQWFAQSIQSDRELNYCTEMSFRRSLL